MPSLSTQEQPLATWGAPARCPGLEGKSLESVPRSVSPRTDPLPVPTAMHRSEPTALPVSGMPRQPGQPCLASEGIGAASVRSCFPPAARTLVAPDKRSFQRNSNGAGSARRGAGQRRVGSRHQTPVRERGRLRRALGTARGTRGGRELSVTGGTRTSPCREPRGSGWAAPWAAAVGCLLFAVWQARRN